MRARQHRAETEHHTMSTRQQAVNLDGTPWFANISAPQDGLTISINEGFVLVSALKEQVTTFEAMASTAREKGLPEATIGAMEDAMTSLVQRIGFLERAIDLAKEDQLRASPHRWVTAQ
jgi:hypothetical protein